MAMLVAEAMTCGAAGFATSSAPTGRRSVTRLADDRELRVLLGELKRAGKGIAAFVPGGPALPLRRLYELQAEIGRPFTYTALLTSPSPDFRERVRLHVENWKK